MCRIERSGSSVLLSAHAAGGTPTFPEVSAWAPSAHKLSQFYCVDNHEQPFRARACLRVQARPARL